MVQCSCHNLAFQMIADYLLLVSCVPLFWFVLPCMHPSRCWHCRALCPAHCSCDCLAQCFTGTGTCRCWVQVSCIRWFGLCLSCCIADARLCEWLGWFGHPPGLGLQDGLLCSSKACGLVPMSTAASVQCKACGIHPPVSRTEALLYKGLCTGAECQSSCCRSCHNPQHAHCSACTSHYIVMRAKVQLAGCKSCHRLTTSIGRGSAGQRR
jgi:hypothetical protein